MNLVIDRLQVLFSLRSQHDSLLAKHLSYGDKFLESLTKEELAVLILVFEKMYVTLFEMLR